MRYTIGLNQPRDPIYVCIWCSETSSSGLGYETRYLPELSKMVVVFSELVMSLSLMVKCMSVKCMDLLLIKCLSYSFRGSGSEIQVFK